MPIAYRPTSFEDLDPVDALVVSSINELTERHGFGHIASRSVPRFQAFSLQDDPRGLWTAEDNDMPVGFAWSWTCEDFWFLAQLFVKPGIQSGGIGRILLLRTMQHADAVGARNRALITFAFNTASQGLYVQHGFLPRFPVYLMSIPAQAVRGRVPDRVLEVSPVDGSDAEIALLSELDRLALGSRAVSITGCSLMSREYGLLGSIRKDDQERSHRPVRDRFGRSRTSWFRDGARGCFGSSRREYLMLRSAQTRAFFAAQPMSGSASICR